MERKDGSYTPRKHTAKMALPLERDTPRTLSLCSSRSRRVTLGLAAVASYTSYLRVIFFMQARRRYYIPPTTSYFGVRSVRARPACTD